MGCIVFGVPHIYVSWNAGQPWFTTFRHHRDGSWGFDFLNPHPGELFGAVMHATGRNDPTGERGIASLTERGFVTLADAERLGWVPIGWRPTEADSGPVNQDQA
jgi:hypothetical protein